MKKRILLLTCISAGLLINGCKKEPTACATADKTKIIQGESVSFTSCSTDGVKYSWDFGDGSAAYEGESASHQYDSTGTYLVQLKAFSKKNKLSDKYSLIITVNPKPVVVVPPPVIVVPKDRYLKKIVLRGFAATNTSGGTWDAILNTDPDIILKLKLASGGFEIATAEQANITAAALPLTFNYEPNNFKISNEDWILEILDNDLTSAETMGTFTKNLYTATLSSTGVITCSDTNGNIVDIYIVEK